MHFVYYPFVALVIIVSISSAGSVVYGGWDFSGAIIFAKHLLWKWVGYSFLKLRKLFCHGKLLIILELSDVAVPT